MIKKSIVKSQHCQRNWDLNKSIPSDDLNLIETSLTECPSKQNIVFYIPYLIQDRKIIEDIHNCTNGFVRMKDNFVTTNSQTLANLLVVLVEDNSYQQETPKNIETKEIDKDKSKHILEKDKLISVGVASGYCNLTSAMLGYSTGCCTCFDNNAIKKILNVDGNILLLMGIGYPDDSRNRREHHIDETFIFPTLSKKIKAIRL
jgi:nitroreductase